MTSFTDATTWGRRGQAPPSPFGKCVKLGVKVA